MGRHFPLFRTFALTILRNIGAKKEIQLLIENTFA